MKTLGYEFDDEEFEYDVDYGDIYDILVKKFADDYGLKINVAKDIIDDYSLWDDLESIHEDYLLELYEDDARNAFEESKEYRNDPYSYYGVSRNDF